MKLSCWFGERDRVDGELLADQLLGLFGSFGIETSIMLRGIEGFGLRHHMRTDRLLTLSEDLPAVAIALDRSERIEQILPSVLSVKRRGLITLERARLLRAPSEADLSAAAAGLSTAEAGPSTAADAGLSAAGEAGVGAAAAASLGAAASEGGQLDAGRASEALKLTLHIGRHRRTGRKPAFVAACEILHRHRASGATTLLGVDGTRAGRRHRARMIGRNERVPMMVMSVGERDPILAALPELARSLEDVLFTIERVRVCRRDGVAIADPHEPHNDQARRTGSPLWQKLTVVTSEASLHQGSPVHMQLVRQLRAAGGAGATSLRGVWGFHGDHAPHGDKLLSLRRHVPVVTVLVDSPERIERAYPIVAELTAERGLVTSELVPAMRAAADSAEIGDLRIA